jgi:hypothetical protein
MKQKITLTYENIYTTDFADHCGTPRKLIVELPGDITISELLEEFNLFIRGIGYFPPENARLDYVDNDTDEPKSTP